MKIAMINKFYPPIIGGIEYHVRLLSENLAKLDNVERIEILVANYENKILREKIDEKINITRLPNWKTISSTPIAPSFINELQLTDVDLFHFHFPYPFADFSWLLSGNRQPFVITYHSDILRQKILNNLYVPIRNRFFSKAKRIIATSPNMVQNSRVLKKFEHKVEIIPLGIDPSPYIKESVIEESMKIKACFNSKPLVLFVGRLVYYKGVEILIEAFRNIEANLIMIGRGELEEKLKRKVRNYGIESKVHFYSDVDDTKLAAYFNACDMFVLPSIANTEAYGLVQLEAHACGKPVVSTNLPTGVPFVNLHNQTGLVVEPNNSDALRQAIQTLVYDEVLRESFGRNAKRRMFEMFSHSHMTDKIYMLYCNILNEG